MHVRHKWTTGPRVVVWLVTAVMAVACGSGGSAVSGSGQPTKGGTLVIALGADPKFLNPDLATDAGTQQIGSMIYEGLVWINAANNTPEPLLAKSWTISPDGLTYTFMLAVVQWSDGQPVTSTDVKYTLLQVGKISPPFAKAWNSIQSIDDSDPHTAVITLKQPFGPFLQSLSQHGAAILPAHIFQGTSPLTNPASLDKPVGTGPFLLQEWVRGDHVTLVRNPKYWRSGQPLLDKIVAKVLPSGSGAILALEAGSVDFVQSLIFDASFYPQITKNPKLTLHPGTFAPTDDYIFFNVNRAPYNDPAVRQALFMALDRTYFTKNVWAGYGQGGVGPFDNRLTWAYNSQIDYNVMYPYDVAKAKSMLDAAGYKVGANGTRFNMDLVVDAASGWDTLAPALKSMWGTVGVNVTIDEVGGLVGDNRVFIQHDFDVAPYDYTTNGDPALGIARVYTTASIGTSYGNGSGYSNPQVDQLFASAQVAGTQAARATYYQQVQAILAKDLPVLTIHQDDEQDAVSKRVHLLWAAQNDGEWGEAWVSPA